MISRVKNCLNTFANRIAKDKREFRIEKSFNRKDNRLYVKWQGYDHSFNS